MFDQKVMDVTDMFENLQLFGVICDEKGIIIWENSYARKSGYSIHTGDCIDILFGDCPQLFFQYMESAKKKRVSRGEIVYFGKVYELSVKGFEGDDHKLYSFWSLTPVVSKVCEDQEKELMVESVYRSELFRIFNVLIPLNQMLDQSGLYEAREYLECISQSSYKMLKAVINASEYYKLRSKQFQFHLDEINMHFFLQDLISQIKMLMAKSGKTMSFQAEDSSLNCVADSEKLTLAFLNIFANAIEFAINGSEIRVKLSRMGNDAIITVINEGDGILKENLGKVTEPFFSYDPVFHKAHGIGLGLPVAQEIIKAHGGSLLIASTENMGTTLTVRIPLSKKKNTEKKFRAPNAQRLPMISDRTSPLYAFLAESCHLEWI